MRVKATMWTTAVLAMAAITAAGQDRVNSPDVNSTTNTTTNTAISGTGGQTTLLSDIMNSDVMLQNNENVGQINDFVIGPQGNIQFAIGSGNNIGNGNNNNFAIPFSALSVNSGNQSVNLNLSRDQFNELNFFSKNKLPDFSSRDFRQNLTQVFGDRAMDRLNNARDVRQTAQDNRQDTREARQDVRETAQDGRQDTRDARQDARQTAQDGRQDTRDARQDARQDTRDDRQDSRQARDPAEDKLDSARNRGANDTEGRDNLNPAGKAPPGLNKDDKNTPRGRGNLGANNTEGRDTLNPAGKAPPGLNKDNRTVNPRPPQGGLRTPTPQNPQPGPARPGTANKSSSVPGPGLGAGGAAPPTGGAAGTGR